MHAALRSITHMFPLRNSVQKNIRTPVIDLIVQVDQAQALGCYEQSREFRIEALHKINMQKQRNWLQDTKPFVEGSRFWWKRYIFEFQHREKIVRRFDSLGSWQTDTESSSNVCELFHQIGSQERPCHVQEFKKKNDVGLQ